MYVARRLRNHWVHNETKNVLCTRPPCPQNKPFARLLLPPLKKGEEEEGGGKSLSSKFPELSG